jgi:DNA-binding transcriptional LysR family regulator
VLLLAVDDCANAQAPQFLSPRWIVTRRRIDWTDLQFVLAVATRGSVAAAARALGVNHTTVLRRVQAFERSHGVRLFDRLPSGYAMTAAGEDLLAGARSVADMVDDLERRIAGQDLRLEGELRVTTTDTLMSSILPPILGDFQRRHPAVRLDVSVATELANLGRREADLAIRVTTSPPEMLIGRRICAVRMAIYRASTDPRPPARLPELLGEKWIDLADAFAETSVGRWMRAHVHEDQIVLRTDNFVAMSRAAAAGIGLAALPAYLGDSIPDLKRASPVISLQPTPALWILSHKDLRQTARVRAFSEFVGAALNRERDRIEGGLSHP